MSYVSTESESTTPMVEDWYIGRNKKHNGELLNDAEPDTLVLHCDNSSSAFGFIPLNGHKRSFIKKKYLKTVALELVKHSAERSIIYTHASNLEFTNDGQYNVINSEYLQTITLK